jgi:hypothetical protein
MCLGLRYKMKSKLSLLGACTSCPVLHEKLDVSFVYARSLEVRTMCGSRTGGWSLPSVMSD